MPEILPFRALRFNQKDIDSLVCPPYDIIGKDYQKELLAKDKYNIVNVVLPDGDSDIKYENAKKILNKWIELDKLIFDNDCSYYAYSCKYFFEDKEYELFGFLGALKLEKLGISIKAHEKTLKGPKIDRFKLITNTNAMFCPIMMIYDNKNLSDFIKDNANDTLYEVNFENQLHKIFRIKESNIINHIKAAMNNETLIIADGHHRYETCLAIKAHYEQRGIELLGSNYALVLFIDKQDKLSLLPIHRLIKKIDIKSLKEKMGNFLLNAAPNDYDIIMYDGDFSYWKFKEIKTNLVEGLDAKLFEEIVYKKILGLTDEDIANNEISGYAHSKREVVESVNSKEAAVGFLLKPVSYEKLFEIVYNNLTFPQKSTFFYPKIPSGLVGYHFNSIRGCENV